MQLTRYTDYSLRTLIFLAARPDELTTVGDIATVFSISHNHLMKVVHHLVQAGYVTSRRGKNGGLNLARAAKDITVAEVVRAMEPSLNIVECFAESHTECILEGGCRLRSVLADARSAFLVELKKVTIDDLLTQGAQKQLFAVSAIPTL
ncbi:MAG: Rrf2 family transcriptional regulator [Gammaproteobacteria bacterium]|nr:MAG: Rrf2 family transcriptional regulator [Gammaproteobacteria bacterium]